MPRSGMPTTRNSASRRGPSPLRRLEEGGQDLASLWYSAWIEAGKPSLPTAADVHINETLDKPTHDPDKIIRIAPAVEGAKTN